MVGRDLRQMGRRVSPRSDERLGGLSSHLYRLRDTNYVMTTQVYGSTINPPLDLRLGQVGKTT